ncbi:peptidoglycan-binding protein [Alkalihalophilus marmarensis]|uniref:peptidoglycan-binding protein n=1 Tax=Alkalihalophilus marmarensis TaxID=521377 RepID=UPI002E1A57C3|nr:peptidoglycan-binding protein [Alkalihalophilus marmarensis]
MTYTFQNLPQLVDSRGKLPSKGTYSRRTRTITDRVWHHSLTKKDLAGSTAEAFARYHVNTLGWPGVGYALIIEPRHVIQTPSGPRARIVYANDIDRRTYHVGNSNQYSLGICVAGDYRTDVMDEATLTSIAELHAALFKDRIGQKDRSHNEMPGYGWKGCCVYDYRKAIKWQGSTTPIVPTPLPGTYTIQEGDTFWSIAHKDGAGGITVDDLIKANPDVNPTNLQVGQVINFGNAVSKPIIEPLKPVTSTPATGRWATIQSTLNSRYSAGLVVDNTPGPLTKRGIVRGVQTELNAQTNARLIVDGIVGPKTRAAFINVHSGSRGNLTWLLQAALLFNRFDPGVVDGVNGTNTQDALTRFQRAHGLTVDGIAGAQTWSVLLR